MKSILYIILLVTVFYFAYTQLSGLALAVRNASARYAGSTAPNKPTDENKH